MNMQETPTQSRRTRPLWLYAVVGAFLLLALTVGMPAWASSTPEAWQQGTVPPPPTATATPEGDDDDSQPSATATPAAGGGAAAPAPTPAGTPSRYTGVVSAPRLNVRSGPGVEFDVLGRLFEGEEVQILFRDELGDWWYTCCISGTTTSGWVSALFVTPAFDVADALTLIPLAENLDATGAESADVQATLGVTNATVSTFRLNLRSSPSISGTILGKLDNGTVVTVTARNEEGDWWYVCCAPDGETTGWVAARFLEPGFPRASASEVIPLFGAQGVVLPTPTPGPRSTPAVTPSAPTTATEVSGVAAGNSLTETETGATIETTATLEIEASQAPTLAVQGAPLELRYVISNTGSVTASAVELRNELPESLVLNRGTASNGARFTAARTETGAELFAFLWPEIAPGDVITAGVVVTVSSTLTDGLVIENLAALSAENAAAQTAVLNIGLPPAGSPDFR